MFFFNNKYSVNIFYGIIPDTRAAGVSIAEELKFKPFSSLIAPFRLTN